MLHVRESGTPGAPVVLLVHGQCLDGAVFGALPERLARRFRVLVPDLPGYGRTPLPAVYDREVVRGALEAALLERGVEALSVVGYSMGGYDALALTLSGKVRVERLALLGALAWADDATRTTFAQVVEAIRGGASLGPLFARTALPSEWADAHPREAASLAAQVDSTPRATLVADLSSVGTLRDLRLRLGGLRVPVLVRVGSLDQNVPRRFSEEIARLVPGARLEIVPAVGHAYLLQDAEATIRSIDSFLVAPGGTPPGRPASR